ncbi:FAD-dependent oxidoreductase [Natranaeroarchaeum aerophilus]|uniref:NAD(P)/FAD-dependent oxidoreductase n=1 Tax=Natranaeroarchaeum aerophilus TaxID=2917711 RepID=A0AAE3FRZ0_9EURY|nr:NAD(P)/FAD-dependent oxidoreductase [Natranaeroarchaeum aerophilus]MCL9814223.1 NAD(P)/FAD-dependent oxidoreductase [Natranaeroarchaeum aerophilus]
MVHVAIIGAYGSAGVAVAGDLVDVDGVELTLIDDGDPGGGLCILDGCMPSKEVLSAGEARFKTRHDDRVRGTPEIDLDQVVATKDDHTLGFAEHRRAAVHDLAERETVEFIHDTARLVDDRVLAVGDRRIEPDYLVIATGSTVDVPDLPGIDKTDFSTSADVLDTTGFPDSGIVMGFGYVGLELAPYIAEAGETDLTVIEHDAVPLDEADSEYGAELLDIYEENFDIDVRTHTHERRLESTDEGGVRLHVDHEPPNGEASSDVIEADELFLFTGRKPALDGLGLDHTALEPGPDWVEDPMQARDDERVFVVGDANGHEPILHVAKEQGFKAAENILAHSRGDPTDGYENVHHHVVFSGLGVYPYARVGHSEASATAAGIDHIAVTRSASDDGVFKTKAVPEGRATLVVGEDGTVLGYQGLHYHADVMAKTMQIAVEMGLDVREIPDRSYHPTTPEILDGLLRDASAKLEYADTTRSL